MDECFPEFVRLLKERFSSHNILLTNGCIFWERHVDEVCVSIKAITKDLFMKFTNSRCIDLILDNFKKYSKSKITLRAETVYIPNFIEVDEIERIASFIAKVDPEIPYRIDAYIPYEGDMFRRPTRKEIERAKNIAKKYLRNVSVLHEGMGLKYEVKRVY
jgi:pyruvate-formate lyase-activating enzyme